LGYLSEVGGHLIHIYGQHEHQALLKPETHTALLDAHGGLEERAEEMKKRHRSLGLAWDSLRQARGLLEKRKREEESLRGQGEEISQARLQVGEEEELKAKKNILIHAERLYQGCKEGEEILYEGEDALVDRLGRYVLRLRELANIDGGLNDAVDLLESSLAQLEEATSVLRRYTDRVQFDPAALEKLEDRLAEISRLKRKYNGPIEGTLIHDLRRCAARNLSRAGVPETVAMEITGHKSRSMYRRYRIVDERDLREGIEKLQAHLETQKDTKVVALKVKE